MTSTTWGFSQQFTHDFQSERAELQSLVTTAQGQIKPEAKALQDLALRLVKLSKSLTDATGSLPNYDRKLYDSQIKQLETDIEALRTTAVAKPKFSFRRKTPAVQSTPPPISSNSPVLSDPISTTSSSSEDAPGIPTRNLVLQNHSGRYISASDLEFPESTPAMPDLSISNLSKCIVNLLPNHNAGILTAEHPFGAYHIRNLTQCIVMLPFCPGSALIHELRDCVLVLGCHQFRMHDSEAVDIYLHISSNPIIETCRRIRFAMYPSKLAPELLLQPPLPPLSVQDFSHIRSSPSPNFSLMPDKLATEAKSWPLDKESVDLETALASLLPAVCVD